LQKRGFECYLIHSFLITISLYQYVHENPIEVYKKLFALSDWNSQLDRNGAAI